MKILNRRLSLKNRAKGASFNSNNSNINMLKQSFTSAFSNTAINNVS